jgi:hypothetical protein
MCDMEMGVCGTTKRFLGAHSLGGLLFAESVVKMRGREMREEGKLLK